MNRDELYKYKKLINRNMVLRAFRHIDIDEMYDFTKDEIKDEFNKGFEQWIDWCIEENEICLNFCDGF